MSEKKLPFLIAALLTAVLAVATFTEPVIGSETTHRMFYGAWWFRILWGALALSGAWLCWRRRLWKRPVVALLHLSFLLILCGALTTSLTATEGSLMLYEGEQSSLFLTKDNRVAHLDFALRLDSFRIDCYADTGEPSGYRSHVTILDPDSSASVATARDKATISMNHILRYRRLRFCQAGHTPDGHGSILMVVHDPYGIGITYAGYALLMLSAVLMLLPKRLKRPSAPVVAAYVITAACALAYTLRWVNADHLLPVLRSPLLGVHIGTIIVAYVLFLLMAVLSAWEVICHRTLAMTVSGSTLPRTLLLPAVLFLSVGIFLGAIWANLSWGNYWSWDPKEVWALITLLLYSLPLHRKSLPWFNTDRNLHLYLIFAFVSVLVTYFGVNFVLGGMHSYA